MEPASRIPIVAETRSGDYRIRVPMKPFMDLVEDNHWYFSVMSDKYYDYDRQAWAIQEGFHWTRGVGRIQHGPTQEFIDHYGDI